MRDCPGASDLETLASRDEATPAVRRHVARCPACKAQLEAVRANDRFLIHAAGDLAEALRGELHPQVSSRPLPERDSIPGYRIVEEISCGGQGVVYRAIQSDTKRPAAIKMLLAGAFASDRQVYRFERETELAAGLRHPNIVTIFQSGAATDGGRYVAMEFVTGVPLDHYVEDTLGRASSGGKARADAVMRLIVQVAMGVGHAHTAGIIHRDIKPSNILVDEHGVPRVLDFGLARSIETAPDARSNAPMTESFAGTPAYAAPERLNEQHEHTDARSDVYSMGMMLYRLLTGVSPYPCDGPIAAVARHAAETMPAPPSRSVPRLPKDVQTIVLRCLTKDPQRRYASASALAEDIEDYLAGNPIAARRDSATYVLRKLVLRNRAASAAVAIVALTVLLAAIGFALLATDLDRARREIEATLSDSTVQRARFMAKAGDPQQAEALLWDEAIAAGITTSDLALWEAPASRLRSAWSLAEFYAGLPRLMRARADTFFRSVGLDPERELMWAIDNSGSRWSWSFDGRPIKPTPELASWPTTSVASPNGRYVVLHGELDGKRTAQVWDVDQGTVVGPSFASEQSAYSMLVEDEGRVLVRLNEPELGSTLVWNVDDGTSLALFGPEIFWVHLDRDAQGELFLLVGTRDQSSARVSIARPPNWDVHRSVDIPNVPVLAGKYDRMVSPVLSHDGQMLAAAVGDQLLLFDVSAAPELLSRVDAPTVNIGQIVFDSQDRSLIVTGTTDGVLMIFAVPGLDLRHDDTGAFGRIASAGDPPLAAMTAADGVAVYATTDRPWLTRIKTNPQTQMSITTSLHGTLAWGDDVGTLYIRPIREPHDATPIPAHDDEINAVCWSPDGATLLTTGADGAIREWKSDGRPLRVVAEGLPPLWSVQYSLDGRSIAAGDFGGVIRVWREAGHDGPVEPFAYHTGMHRLPMVRFSPDGRRLLCAAVSSSWEPAKATVLDLETGEQLHELYGHGTTIRAVAWSSDGELAVTGGDDRALRVWDAESGDLLRTIRGLPWGPYDLVFHPRGSVLFAVGPGGSIVVIDPHAGVELAQLPVHDRSIFSIALSPDGTKLYTSGQDPWIGITDLNELLGYIRGNENYWREAEPLE
ncbi:MAG: protein kinase [Phycisphaera sp.]|nr:MAG: protein kinase [Phycisphaera sp.]